MWFVSVLALIIAVAIIFATVGFVWTVSAARWARLAAVAGVSSLVTGSALYVVVIFIALNYYGEQASPSWLTALAVLAFVLAGGGLLGIVSAAFGAARRGPTSR